jgi:hypothetical protein
VTDFSVQPAALRDLATMLGRARQDIDTAKAYLAKMETFDGGTGYLGYCLDGPQAVYRTFSDWLGKLGDPTLSGTAAVAESANYYEKTDAAVAANLDATGRKADLLLAQLGRKCPLANQGHGRV